MASDFRYRTVYRNGTKVNAKMFKILKIVVLCYWFFFLFFFPIYEKESKRNTVLEKKLRPSNCPQLRCFNHQTFLFVARKKVLYSTTLTDALKCLL